MPSFDGSLLTTADMSRKGEFEVEEVRAVRYDSGTGEKHCLIKWKDFDESHVTWEPIGNATHAQAAVKKGAAVSKWTWEFYLDAPSLKPPLAAGWHPYDQPSQDMMTNYFRKYCVDAKQMDGQIECVRSGKFHYLIDFWTMEQTNVIVAARTVRPIRCLPA
jgi:hypothetical protein